MVKLRSESPAIPMDEDSKPLPVTDAVQTPDSGETKAEPTRKPATRGRKPKPKAAATAVSVASTGSYRVFYLSGELCNSKGDLKLVHLRNPCTGEPSRYICLHDTHKYYELLAFGEPFRSWFVNDLLTIDGSIYITTVVDPLFLILHYVQNECTQNYVPLANVLVDSKFAAIQAFADALPTSQLLMICDQKGAEDLKAIRYNEAKTLKWLTLKAQRLRAVLEQRKLYVVAGAKSATFVKSEKLETEPDDGGLLAYAVGMIGEYISEELCEKLLAHLGLESVKPKAHKRKSTGDVLTSTKRIKSLTDDGSEDTPPAPPTPSPKVVEKKQTAKAKAMVKAASGSKNIMSFFQKK